MISSTRHILFLLACLVLAIPAGATSPAPPWEGWWKGDFGGVILSLSSLGGDNMSLYQSSATSLALLGQFSIVDGSFETSDQRSYRLEVGEDLDRLSILNERGDLFLSFQRMSFTDLPPDQSATLDPEVNFDFFVEAFQENYALFDVSETNWQFLADQYRDQIPSASQDELYSIFSNMIDPLGDNHTVVIRSDTNELFRSGPASDPFWQYRENEFLNNIAESYIGAPLERRTFDTRIHYGILPGNVAYLSVSSFLDLPSRRGISTTMAEIFAELGPVEAYIIDLRFNLGGTDLNSLAFLERIMDPAVDAVYARQRRLSTTEPGLFTDIEIQSVRPLENPAHERPVIVLTSRLSASAADTVMMALMNQPNVTQVGEPTRGVFSNLLFRYLPNGWAVSLSNERFYSLAGGFYEQLGIAPQLEVSQDDYDLDNGIDAGLEAALELVDRIPPTPELGDMPETNVTGLWYDPDRSGEGWHLQQFDEARVFVSFYTLDPADPGQNRWLTGLGRIEGSRIMLDQLVTTTGGEFGAGADGQPISEVPWGRGEIRFSECGEAVARLSGPDEYRGFVFKLRRLTALPGAGCGQVPAEPETAIIYPGLSGAWYVKERPGEGWLISHNGADRAVISWYTFDDDGAPMWLTGVGSISVDGVLSVEQMETVGGTRYGHHFDPEAVQRTYPGALEFQLEGCDRGKLAFTSGEQAWVFETDLLASLAGLARDSCE